MTRAGLGRRQALIGGASAFAVAGSAQAQILGRLRSAVPGTGFSVSGKPGPFLKQIAQRKIEPVSVRGDTGLGFSSGEFQAARLSMPQTQAKIEALIEKLAAYWPYQKPPKVRVNMVGRGEYSPNALPDGTISVPVGFLVRAESDDEIAFVIGHEYAHVALGHFARNERLKTQRKIVTQAAQLYTSVISLSQIRLQQSGQQANLAVADRQKVEAAHAQASRSKDRLDWVLNNLVEPVWNRRQEDEADAIGFDLAQAAGYSPVDGAAAAFARLNVDDQAKHALVEQLQNQIDQSIAAANTINNRAALQRGDAVVFMTSFSRNLQSGLRDRALRATETFLSAQHRPPAERQKGIGDYAQFAYPQTALAEPKKKWLADVRATREFTTARTAVAALQQAQLARYDARYADAETAIRKALATPYGSLPLFVNEAARIARDKGDYRTAETQFSRADAHREQTFDGFRDHVLMCISTRAYPRARAVIDAYTKRTGAVKEFWPQLIRINFKDGHPDEAVKLLQRCVDNEEPELRQACAMNAYGPDDAEWDKLPDATKGNIRDASNKAATRMSVGSGFGDLMKSLQGSADK